MKYLASIVYLIFLPKILIWNKLTFRVSNSLNPEAVPQMRSVKKVFLEIRQNSQENTCPRVSFLIKLQAAAWERQDRLWDRCFPVNFEKIQRTFLAEHLRWILS